jgi:hypothetical protein
MPRSKLPLELRHPAEPQGSPEQLVELRGRAAELVLRIEARRRVAVVELAEQLVDASDCLLLPSRDERRTGRFAADSAFR